MNSRDIGPRGQQKLYSTPSSASLQTIKQSSKCGQPFHGVESSFLHILNKALRDPRSVGLRGLFFDDRLGSFEQFRALRSKCRHFPGGPTPKI